MAITNQTPVADSYIDPDTIVAFDIDDTYTTMRIEVTTLIGVEYAWDSSLGGQQSGYEVTITDDGAGTETWTLTSDSGWDITPQIITVFEDETGSPAETALSWTLSGSVVYPQEDKPYYSELGAGFKITEDNAGVVVNVTHLDFVAGAVDGITVTDLGGGKVRLTARAATTDPYAIHTNVAGEIFALTEKTGPAGDDLVILENSADSYNKVAAKRENMGGARAPVKLEDDLDALILYTFDGVLTDSVAGGHTLSTTVGSGQLYGLGIVAESRGLFLEKSWGVKSAAAPLTKLSGAWGGDFTAQAVFFPGKAYPEAGTTDKSIFKIREAPSGNYLFELGFPNSGFTMQPGCWYTDTTPTRNETTSAPTICGDGLPVHMVQRVFDAGGGLYTQEIWLNNTLLSSDTGLAAPFAYNPAKDYIVSVGKDITNSGLCRMVVESVKLSSRKLTDTEIGDEFRKAMGYPAI